MKKDKLLRLKRELKLLKALFQKCTCDAVKQLDLPFPKRQTKKRSKK